MAKYAHVSDVLYYSGCCSFELRERSEPAFGSKKRQHYFRNTILVVSLLPSYSQPSPESLYAFRHLYQKEDSQPTSELCFGARQTRELGQHHGSRSGEQTLGRQGGDAAPLEHCRGKVLNDTS